MPSGIPSVVFDRVGPSSHLDVDSLFGLEFLERVPHCGGGLWRRGVAGTKNAALLRNGVLG